MDKVQTVHFKVNHERLHELIMMTVRDYWTAVSNTRRAEFQPIFENFIKPPYKHLDFQRLFEDRAVLEKKAYMACIYAWITNEEFENIKDLIWSKDPETVNLARGILKGMQEREWADTRWNR